VHARKTAAAALQLEFGRGVQGAALARQARAEGVEVMVCSPGAIARQPGDPIKTDTRDALTLARLHAAGQLRAVLVATLELQALRDLVRAREDLRGDEDPLAQIVLHDHRRPRDNRPPTSAGALATGVWRQRGHSFRQCHRR
jgi:hypothetical protein